MTLRAAALAWAAIGFACRDPLPRLTEVPAQLPPPPLIASLDPVLTQVSRSPPPPAPLLPAAPAGVAPPPPASTKPEEAEGSEEPVGPKPQSSRKASGRKKQKPPVVRQLNLNRATEAELRLLPGVGKGRARAIVERRQQRPFASLEEVERIRGLKSIVRRLRRHLTLTGNTTLRPAPGAVARDSGEG